LGAGNGLLRSADAHAPAAPAYADTNRHADADTYRHAYADADTYRHAYADAD
jgi:hypothetical protein